MSNHSYRHFRGTVLRGAITVGLGSQLIQMPALWAQDASAPQTMDRVQITGSLIPTAETVGVAPVETVEAERIALTGQQDILAVLRRYSTSFAGSGNVGQTENNGGYGEANVALRNLSTLVLLDGRRLAGSSFSNGTAVDLNTLPLAMIDRTPGVVGLSPWVLKDFRSPRRHHSRFQDYWNRKGLIDAEGARKPAFEVLADYYRRRADGR